MLKSLAFLSLALITLSFGSFNHVDSTRLSKEHEDCFSLEEKANGHYKITGVKADYLDNSELRIYFDESKIIDEIGLNSFDGCSSLTTLMISYAVEVMPTSLFTNPADYSSFSHINYTGSEEEWTALSFSFASVSYEACDEGFIKVWNDEVRPTADSNICDVTPAQFDHVFSLYKELSEADRNIVDAYEDLAGDQISKSIAYLNQIFNDNSDSGRNETKEVSPSTMITFILVIAVGGMTFIMVFYYLKDKKIIQ